MNQQLLDNFFTDVPVHSSGFATDKNPNVSDESEEVNNNNDDDDDDDLVSKKQRRQLRNRDAAVRSRERKKTYVKHLEMKSRYLVGEFRRLGRLLQCVVARIKPFILVYILQNGNASLANQESAVLFLESLLLGSLLWSLGIMCLFTLPSLTLSNLESVEEKAPPGNLAQRGAVSNHFTLSGLTSRRCKASRTKMKFISHALRA